MIDLPQQLDGTRYWQELYQQPLSYWQAALDWIMREHQLERSSWTRGARPQCRLRQPYRRHQARPTDVGGRDGARGDRAERDRRPSAGCHPNPAGHRRARPLGYLVQTPLPRTNKISPA